MNIEPNLTSATIRGAIWGYTSNYGGKLLSFIATTILAWLLTQEDFGVAGYALVAINFLDVLSNLGIGAAVIYQKEKPRVADTAFWLSLIAGVLFCAVTWAAAPLIGAFFNDMRSIPLTRVLGLTFVFSGLSSVHNSLLAKHLDFGKKAIPDLIQSFSKGLISIIFALAGFGAWSLVLGQVSGQLVSTVVYWWVLPWRPSFQFSTNLAREILSYGSGMISVNFLGMLLLNIDYIFIGRFLTAAALGIYTLAFRIPELLIKRFSGTLASVVFPVFTHIREAPEELTKAYLNTLFYVSIVTIPMGVGLALVADPFVVTLFSQKWAAAGPVLRAIAIYSTITALTFNTGDILKAQGRMKLLVTISLSRLLISIPLLWWVITTWSSIIAVAWAQVSLASLTSLIYLLIAHYMFVIPVKTILKSFRTGMISGGVMAAAVILSLQVFPTQPTIVPLLGGVSTGAAAYLITLNLLQPGFFREAGSMLQAALQGR